MIGDARSRSEYRHASRRSRLPWWVVAPWVIAGVVLIGAAAAGVLPRALKTDPAPPGQAGALVWGDGVFANKLELGAWLRLRGVSYDSWASKHPAAVKLLG